MGKKWFNKKKQKKNNADGSKVDKPKRERPQVGYEELVRESKEFVLYYKAQKIVPEDEWETFLKYLKQDLPAAFRFTGSRAHARSLIEIIQQKFVHSQTAENGQQLELVSLPWYPDQLGWQLNLTRKDIRRSETFWKLHQFLITETETGNISRQEAVSMIPPLLLEVKPNHKVLDMCAAPGSKTAQIIEFLHSTATSSIPSGIVIANDVDNKRCYMLTHQAKRLQSPTLLITNHDAAFMPNVHQTKKDGSVKPMKFDRILCDVPCSGDGTLRKNFDVWTKWNAVNGANLHGLQLRIARRGLEMLSVGGRLVYSTCSLNPLENEAVINRLLAEFESSIQLMTVTEKLPGLKFVPGLTHWTVMNRELEVIPSPEEIPPHNTNYIHKHLFPPSAEELQKRNLTRCIRILPHHQNTGGFFVAVIEKVKLLPGEKVFEDSVETVDSGALIHPQQTQKTKMPPKKRRCRGYKEEPFFFMAEESDVWKSVSSFFGFHDTLEASNFLARTESGRGKNLYFANAFVRDVVSCNESRMKIINTGVKVLVRCDNKGSLCNYRLAQEGSQVLVGHCSERKVKVQKEDLIYILKTEDTEPPPQIEKMHKDTQAQCDTLVCGSVILLYDDGSREGGESPALEIQLVGWKGKLSLRCYVAKNDRVHYLRLLGCDTSAYEKNKFAEEKEATRTDSQDKASEECPLSPQEKTDSVIDSITDPVNDSVTDLITDPVNDSVTDLITDPVNDLITDPVNDVITDPVNDVITDPVNDVINDPVNESVTESVVQ